MRISNFVILVALTSISCNRAKTKYVLFYNKYSFAEHKGLNEFDTLSYSKKNITNFIIEKIINEKESDLYFITTPNKKYFFDTCNIFPFRRIKNNNSTIYYHYIKEENRQDSFKVENRKGKYIACYYPEETILLEISESTQCPPLISQNDKSEIIRLSGYYSVESKNGNETVGICISPEDTIGLLKNFNDRHSFLEFKKKIVAQSEIKK